MKEKIIIIVGPTAVGKTNLSLSLAKKFNGEIISGDSMQIYKGLDIGTAKATNDERKEVTHYLIDEIDPSENYTVADFKSKAKKLIHDITAKGKVPIIVGGTGLYIESLLYNVSHGGQAEPNLTYRNSLEAFAEQNGKDKLWEKLQSIDPKAAESIHYNNTRRVIRALEVYHSTGRLFSSLQMEKSEKEKLYDAYVVGLTTDRSLLYERINQRVDLMLQQGLIEEVKTLLETVPITAQSVKGIGYKEFIPYFENCIDLESATEQIKQNSRRYAKRQLTWFRNRLEISSWWDLVQVPEQQKELENKIENFLRM
ncbi:tRNA (adenosine(37)-N6)-dimethylallyltransferase MiaA [Marinilactibacillus psychrotolerans]|uniref:tRNA (adenosine(37)-N6)-dimethylallyltransferase MiaA n=1 Tax=Marinilactibacillus psychrotolerans TaxID=191770 RepID=UPI003886310C